MHRFIHIPKNGGSAVTAWLIQNQIDFLIGKPGRGVGKHKKACNWLNEPSQKFCVVRNPYNRIISYYNYIGGVEQWTSFEEFIKNKISPIKFKIPSPWELQISWIDDDQGNSLCDKILRYENLEIELQNYFGCTAALPKINETVDKSVILANLTDELKQIVYLHFKSDFDRFDYQP